jgi:hypothetical protein
MVFEERLPDNVGRVADDAEYGEFDDRRNVEGKWRLSLERISSEEDSARLQRPLTLSW